MLVLLTGNVYAAARWGGSFQTFSSPTFAPPFGDCPLCADLEANRETGACSCPPTAEMIQPIATVSDCAGKDSTGALIIRPAALALCIPNSGVSANTATASSTFAGAFQIDPTAPDGTGCRSVNLRTGSCSCPRMSRMANYSLLAPTGFPPDATVTTTITTLVLCMNNSMGAPPSSSFGAFLQLDPIPSIPVPHRCATPNPSTGSCACPINALHQPHRVIVPYNGAIAGATLSFCYDNGTPPAAPASIAPTLGLAEICTGVNADNSGLVDASAAIQTCINATTDGGQLLLPPGTYLIANGLRVSRSITISTRFEPPPRKERSANVDQSRPGCGRPGASPCAVLRAARELNTPYGILLVTPAGGKKLHDVTLQHIVLDGNRGERLDNIASLSCGGVYQPSSGRQPGYTSGVHSCTGCALRRVLMINALCGTSCEWSGADAVIEGSTFLNNGDHFGRQSGKQNHKWADGLTLTDVPGVLVRDNLFMDNSDVNLIVANGTGGRIENNTVRMVIGGAFAGIMLDSFGQPELGNFAGMLVLSNTVACGNRCHYGLEIGPRPWYQPSNLVGPATVTGNTVSGAAILVNVDGAGIPGGVFTLVNTTYIGKCTPGVTLNCHKTYCDSLVISPNSSVDRGGETVPAAAHYDIVNCP